MTNHPNRSRAISRADVTTLKAICLALGEFIKCYDWRNPTAGLAAQQQLVEAMNVIRKIERIAT